MGLLNSNFAQSRWNIRFCLLTLSAAIADFNFGAQRNLVMAYIGATFAIGRTLSSALGGFTTGLFFANPFVAPGLFAAIPVAVTFISFLFVVPETNVRACRGASAPGSPPRLTMRNKFVMIARDTDIAKLLVAYGLLSFANGGVLVGIVLYVTTAVAHHGLGWPTSFTGVTFSVFGMGGFLFQILFMKRLLHKFGLRPLLRFGTLMMAAIASIFSLPSLLLYNYPSASFSNPLCYTLRYTPPLLHFSPLLSQRRPHRPHVHWIHLLPPPPNDDDCKRLPSRNSVPPPLLLPL